MYSDGGFLCIVVADLTNIMQCRFTETTVAVKHTQAMRVNEPHESSKKSYYNHKKNTIKRLYIWWEVLHIVTHIQRSQYIPWDKFYLIIILNR